MQAIQTKFIGATNSEGSRIKASCERGTVTVPYPHELSGEHCHRYAVDFLIAKFVKDDAGKYGTHANPWSSPYVTGELPDGTYAHVFI